MGTASTAIMLILSVPAILGLVNLLKKDPLRMPSSWAALAAVVIGIALSVAVYLFGTNGLFVAIVQGLELGMSAAGVFDISKASGTTVHEAPEIPVLEPGDMPIILAPFGSGGMQAVQQIKEQLADPSSPVVIGGLGGGRIIGIQKAALFAVSDTTAADLLRDAGVEAKG